MDDHEVSVGEHRDDLGSASLTLDRLRRFIAAPTTPAENAQARRWLDGRTGGMCRR